MGRTQHYKLPYDDEHDKDIIDWINSFSRNKKGEMVRHAIRFYMSQLGEGESIKFPDSPSNNTVSTPKKRTEISFNTPPAEEEILTQAEKNKAERKGKKPSIGNLK